MFYALLIAASPERCRVLKSAALSSGRITLLRMLEYYPEGPALARLVNGLDADLVILDLEYEDAAADCVLEIRARRSRVGIIGYGGENSQIPVSDSALTARIPFPPDAAQLMQGVDESLHSVRGQVENNLIAFLPAKAGSGASTLALETASALVNRAGQKVLLIEADLRSGILGVMLNAQPLRSVSQALQAASELDTFQIENFVHRKENLDLLLARPSDLTPMPQWHDYFLLLDAVKMQYDFVLVDLPELVNPATREIVQRARQVFTVCTPELPSLRLAQRRLEELRGWRVPDGRIQLLLNRWHSGDISPGDVRALIGRPVFQVIPNDYPTLRRAMMEGRTVGPATKLGKAFGDLAAALLQTGSPAEKSGPLSRLRGFLRPKTTA